MIQRLTARFCPNDYKTIENGCMSEMIGTLNLEPLNIRRTNRRLAIFHKASDGHLALGLRAAYPSEIFSQFCARRRGAPDISTVKHIIPSTPAKTVTNIRYSHDNKILEFTTRQISYYKRIT